VANYNNKFKIKVPSEDEHILAWYFCAPVMGYVDWLWKVSTPQSFCQDISGGVGR